MSAENNKLTTEEIEKGVEYLTRLNEKYDGIGQNFTDYLEGLLHSKGLGYWDYIHVDSLLGLQVPQTEFTDEIIFITYHQITELYFKLIKHELDQLTDPIKKEFESLEFWHKRMARVVNYFRHLSNSFDIMMSGMDPRDFRKFRMSLLPASGFQAVQYRHIEIMSTNLNSLVFADARNQLDVPLEKLYDQIYWKGGGIDMRTKNKTLTLKEFEKKYDEELMQWIKEFKFRNLNYLFYRLDSDLKKDEKLRNLLRQYDELVNVFWKLSHFTASAHHLPADDQGTGGTNWRKYLPPRFQKVIFFETLWSAEERDEWGKAAVVKAFKNKVKDSWMKPNPKEK